MQNLLPTYEGKIDVMPIDPPYNTEIDYIEYKDGNYDNGWVNFMQARLEVAYKLLSKNGVMFIHIDENELLSLTMLCGKIEACYRTIDGQPFRLSPLFTEEMMGFPLMWTTLPFLSQCGEANH